MPIPAFTIDGVLPPYVGPNGLGGASEDLSPYAVTAMEVVTTLALTEQRTGILRGWLRHRAALVWVGRHVSTTLRQPVFEFKLGFLAFGLAS